MGINTLLSLKNKLKTAGLKLGPSSMLLSNPFVSHNLGFQAEAFHPPLQEKLELEDLQVHIWILFPVAGVPTLV